MIRLRVPINPLIACLPVTSRTEIVSNGVVLLVYSVDADRNVGVRLTKWISAGRKEQGFVRADVGGKSLLARKVRLESTRQRYRERTAGL
jgi:hypothetical protein